MYHQGFLLSSAFSSFLEVFLLPLIGFIKTEVQFLHLMLFPVVCEGIIPQLTESNSKIQIREVSNSKGINLHEFCCNLHGKEACKLYWIISGSVSKYGHSVLFAAEYEFLGKKGPPLSLPT